MKKPQVRELVEISRFYGASSDYVIAGGGNTSWKDEDELWIKASGTSLATIGHDGFAVLRRDRLDLMSTRVYSSDPVEREKQVIKDLYASCSDPECNLRPSVETSLHNIIGYSFVVHLHPALVNGLLCGQNSRVAAAELFPDALYVPYTDPGFTLFCEVRDQLANYRVNHDKDPQIILLENHGIFVAADNIDEIREIYSDVFSKIRTRLDRDLEIADLPVPDEVTDIIPAIRMMLPGDDLKSIILSHNTLTTRYYADKASFSKVSAPFTPDMIVYCKSAYLYTEISGTPEEILKSFQRELSDFEGKQGYPRIILVKGYGLLAIGDTWKSAKTSLDVFEDLMKVSYYSESFGGPRFLNPEQIAFIEEWEAESYRLKVAGAGTRPGRVAGRIAIVTGGAMGFGEGIASYLHSEGANVVVADIDTERGTACAGRLNREGGSNRAEYIHADVAGPSSVRNLVKATVERFGGLDLLVSNAGILHAGSLDEMNEELFEKVTRVNYNGYFHCTKYASAVMKIQHGYRNNHFSDIIQINSKSGLRGSNRNFAYAGGKFGGIGLTQSFALELMPYNIKVNSICPGNFFEGPLWSDPENGLFIQYLRAGKVPGAKTVADVKRYYESQVPAGRGCRVEDVMKALYYLVEQEYETGQAVPVTGGQIMLH